MVTNMVPAPPKLHCLVCYQCPRVTPFSSRSFRVFHDQSLVVSPSSCSPEGRCGWAVSITRQILFAPADPVWRALRGSSRTSTPSSFHKTLAMGSSLAIVDHATEFIGQVRHQCDNSTAALIFGQTIDMSLFMKDADTTNWPSSGRCSLSITSACFSAGEGVGISLADNRLKPVSSPWYAL